MLSFNQISRPLFIFYLLVVYVFIQFIWWGYHIIELHRLLSGDLINKKIWMVLGEGSVFMLLLALGVWRVRSAFKKEMELSAQQKNFLLSVTHELKSPLTSVKLYLQTLLKHDVDKEKEKQIINGCLSETERLTTLVENLLLASKLESGIFALHLEEVDVTSVVRQTLAASHLVALTSNQSINSSTHQLVCDIQENITLSTDRNALVSVFTNLLENAIKYSPVNSRIAVSLKKANNTVFFSVSDEGRGIPDAEKLTISKKFYRIENEETRSTKGTGLGLYIVKNLVKQLGGMISVRDNSPKGSVFEVRL